MEELLAPVKGSLEALAAKVDVIHVDPAQGKVGAAQDSHLLSAYD